MFLACAIGAAIAWSGRRPTQRPGTLPEGARIVDEDTYPDGSYDIHLQCAEDAYVRWVESLGMHEIAEDPQHVRRWVGPDVGDCRMSAYFVSSYELGDWGLACGDADAPALEPGVPVDIEVHPVDRPR